MRKNSKERSLQAFTGSLEKLRDAANTFANISVVGPNQEEVDSILESFDQLLTRIEALENVYKTQPVT